MSATRINLPVVSGGEALANFRQRLDGPTAIAMLDEAAGKLLIQLPVGVGKTSWIIKIVNHVLAFNSYDLIILLAPRWDILNEIREQLPASQDVKVLTPRPRKRCGVLDAEWARYEANDCGILGRKQICDFCPHRKKCRWPKQYGEYLQDAKLVLATQQHVVIDPDFVRRVGRMAGAESILVLVDESSLLLRNQERVIPKADLERFIAIQEAAVAGADKPNKAAVEWLNLTSILTEASTQDLRDGKWRFPGVSTRWATDIQARGLSELPESFQFLGFALRQFGQSDVGSRERLANGDVYSIAQARKDCGGGRLWWAVI